jgi:uncharacterized membrane protein YfhO
MMSILWIFRQESKMKRKERLRYYSLYTVIFAVLSFLVFCIFIKNGRSFVYESNGEDGIAQHYMSLVYLGNYLRDILHNLFINHKLIIPQWDMTLGLGADVITTMNYYVLGDPLNLLAVFVSPEKTEYLYTFLIVLRIYLAGLVFSVYCRHWNFRPFYILLGSYIYCFGNFALYTGIMHPFFLNPMIYLPLLLLGIEKIFERKSPAVFVLSVFLSAVSNFYFFYMLSIFMFIYAVFRYVMIFHKIQLKELVGWLIRFIALYVLGIGLAGFLFLPNALSILTSSRMSVAHYVPLLYPAEYYQQFLASFVFNNCGYYTLMGFSSMALLSMFLLFMKKGNLHLKIGTGILVAFLAIPYVGHVLNGFTYVSNRWSFVLAFLVALISVKMLPELKTLTRKEKIKLCFVLLIYTLLALFPPASREKGNFAAVVLVWCCLLVILMILQLRVSLRKAWNGMYMFVLIGCTVAGILLNACARYASFGADMAQKCTESGKVLETVTGNANRLLQESGDNAVDVRMDTAGINFKKNIRNGGCIQNVNSTNFYFSTTNTAVAEYMREMYLNTAFEQSFTDLDGRFVLNALAGCEYTTVYKGKEEQLPYGYEEKIKEDDTYAMYRSGSSLPFSYVYDSYMDKEDYDKLSVTEKQQAALQVCVVDKDEELTGLNEASESVKYTDQEIPYEVESSKDVKVLEDGFKVSRNGGSITLKFDGLDESEIYLIVEDMDYQSEKQELEEAAAVNLNIEYENNKKTIHYMTDKNNFYCGVKDFLANMGYHRGGGKEMTISFQKAGTYTFSDFRIVCQPVKDFSEMTAACKQNGLSDVTFEGNSMTGTITNEESQMLCITIPYCEGWTAYVDGEETNLYQINTLYSGIYLTPGNHTVQMTYHTPFLCEGVWISLCSLLIFTGIMRQYNTKKKKLEYV